jgi:hypothetical protein
MLKGCCGPLKEKQIGINHTREGIGRQPAGQVEADQGREVKEERRETLGCGRGTAASPQTKSEQYDNIAWGFGELAPRNFPLFFWSSAHVL